MWADRRKCFQPDLGLRVSDQDRCTGHQTLEVGLYWRIKPKNPSAPDLRLLHLTAYIKHRDVDCSLNSGLRVDEQLLWSD